MDDELVAGGSASTADGGGESAEMNGAPRLNVASSGDCEEDSGLANLIR